MAAPLPLAPFLAAGTAASPDRGGSPRPGISGGKARSDCGTTGTGTSALPPAAATGGSMGCTAVAGLPDEAASGGRANEVAAALLLAGIAAGLPSALAALASALAAFASALAASAAALASALAAALSSALVSGFCAGAGMGAAVPATCGAGVISGFAASRWGAAGRGRMVAAGSLAVLLPPVPALLAGALAAVLVEATAMDGLPLACGAAGAAGAGLCGAA